MTKIRKCNIIIFILLAIFSLMTAAAVLYGAVWHTITFMFSFASARFYWSDNQYAASPRFYFFRIFLSIKHNWKARLMRKHLKPVIICNTNND